MRKNGQALSIEEEAEKTVERILRQAERPIETDISLRIRQDEVITVNYYIKEAIIPKEETEEDTCHETN